MALDKLVDSTKLNTGLQDTGAIVASMLTEFYGSYPEMNWYIDPEPITGASSQEAYSGFAKDIIQFLYEHPTPTPGGGIPNLDGRKVNVGTFTVASAVSSYTVTHGLGETPEIILCLTSFDETSSNHITGLFVNPNVAYSTRKGSTNWLITSVTPTVNGTTFDVTDGTSSHLLSAGATFFWMVLGAKSGG